jgi:hypothetical protein
MDVRCQSAPNMPPQSEPCPSTALVGSFYLVSLPAFNFERFSAIDELDKTGQFSQMELSTDEDEHSIEMHLPYVRKIFEGYVIQ